MEINHHFAYENRPKSPHLALNLDLFLYISAFCLGPTPASSVKSKELNIPLEISRE